MASSAGPEIERLIQLLSRLPGLGPRSGRRAALMLLKRKDQLLRPLAELLVGVRACARVHVCVRARACLCLCLCLCVCARLLPVVRALTGVCVCT